MMQSGFEDELQAFTAEAEANDETLFANLDKWVKWTTDEWYGDITTYKLIAKIPDPAEFGPYSRTYQRRVKRQALRYVLIDETDPQLGFRERNGQIARCVQREEVDLVLHQLHDLHAHFAEWITLKKAIGAYYWPTRSEDIKKYCLSCHNCQLIGPMRPNTSLLPIMELQPFDMLAFDFMEPISPASRKGNKYVLVIVDYFSRYV